jgi:hypothetical protein
VADVIKAPADPASVSPQQSHEQNKMPIYSVPHKPSAGAGGSAVRRFSGDSLPPPPPRKQSDPALQVPLQHSLIHSRFLSASPSFFLVYFFFLFLCFRCSFLNFSFIFSFFLFLSFSFLLIAGGWGEKLASEAAARARTRPASEGKGQGQGWFVRGKPPEIKVLLGR